MEIAKELCYTVFGYYVNHYNYFMLGGAALGL